MSLEWILWARLVIMHPLHAKQKLLSREKVANPKKQKMGVRGYTKDMVKKFLRTQVAPKIREMKTKEDYTNQKLKRIIVKSNLDKWEREWTE